MGLIWFPWVLENFGWKMQSMTFVLKAQSPQIDSKLKFSVVQLAGIGTILNNTKLLPMGSGWTIFKNNKQWEPI